MAGKQEILIPLREKRKVFKPHNKTHEATLPKEVLKKSPLVQFSMGIACFEEGTYIDRMIDTLSSSPIPGTTDFLVVISDNGSRGVKGIINTEANLTITRQKLEKNMQEKGFGEEFQQVIHIEERLRKLDLEIREGKLEDINQFLTTLEERNTVIKGLATKIPESDALFAYTRAEDTHRTNLVKALQNPEKIIAATDNEYHSLLPKGEPSQEQLDTVRAYARILLGKYDNPGKNLRIAIVQNSETGSFGSVKGYALEAIKQDFVTHHRGEDIKNSVIMIGDMDTDLQNNFVGNTIRAFEKNPEKNALLADIYLVEERKKHGGLELKRLAVPSSLSRIFMDHTNMRDFIVEQGRKPSQLLPKGYGLINRYHLHPGPALIARGDVFEEVPIKSSYGQGEDIAWTIAYQRRYGTSFTFRSTDTAYGFNLRGHDVAQYFLNPKKGLEFLRTRKDALEPYQHIQFQKRMPSDEEYRQFLEGINGHMKRRLLLRDIIREIEKEEFDLDQYSYVEKRYARRSRNGKNEFALVRRIPPELAENIRLKKDEYIAGEITSPEQHAYEKGEKYISVTFPSGENNMITKHFLVATHLKEIAHNITVAETLATHRNRSEQRSIAA